MRSVIAAIFLGTSLLFGWLALRQQERQAWAPVEGEVVRVWSRTSEQPPLETKYGSIPPRKVTTSLIDYTYQVNGRTYSGTAPVGHSESQGFLVYYDPEHPDRSRLDRPETSAVATIVALSGVFLFGGIVLGLGGRRSTAIPQSMPGS